MTDRQQQGDYEQRQAQRGYEGGERFDQESGYGGGWQRQSEGSRQDYPRSRYDQESRMQGEGVREYEWDSDRGDWRSPGRSDWREEQSSRYDEGDYQQRGRSEGQRGQPQIGGRGWSRSREMQSSDQGRGQYGRQDYEEQRSRESQQSRYDEPRYGQQRFGPNYGSRYAGDQDRWYGQQDQQNWEQQFGQQPQTMRGQGGYGQQARFGQGMEYANRGEQRDWRWDQGPYSGKGPRDYRRSDASIRDEACELLTRHGGIDATDININVHEGDITLSGNVPERHMRRMAEDMLENISGVRDINDQLRIGNKPAYQVEQKEQKEQKEQQEQQARQQEQQQQQQPPPRQEQPAQR